MISPKRRSPARRLSYKEALAIWLIGIALSLGIGLLGAASSAPTVRLDTPMLDSLLRMAGTMTFYFAEVHMPRLVGSRKFHVLYAIGRQGRVTEAMTASCRLVNQQKVTAWHLFLAGAVLMLAYGLGLLLWIWALRLLVVQLPTSAMRQEIRRPLPTPALA